MTPEETTALITQVGGDTVFGRLLRIDGTPFWRQRVNNWKRRGLPSSIELEHYQTIEKLKRAKRVSTA